MLKKKYAWMTFLSSNNYYLYLTLGIYKSLKDTNTKYPIYCGVTPEVNATTRNILETVGIKLINLDTSIISNRFKVNKTRLPENYVNAFTKLTLLDTSCEKLFDKIVYIDSDVQVFENIDDLFKYPHMSAIIDKAPSYDETKTAYKLGDSKFCSGLFVWDFKNNPGKGHEILEQLILLDTKIAWHDQTVLNYFYQDWNEHPELHISPSYGVMNFKTNIDSVDKPIKAIHFTSRIKEGWPFKTKKYILEKNWKFNNLYFKEWVTYLSEAVKFYNKEYNLKIPPLYAENLILVDNKDAKTDAYSQPNTYLYF